MARESTAIDVTFADSASLSSVFNMSGAANLQVIMPAAWTAARLGFHVSDSYGGTYVPLKKGSDDSLIQLQTGSTSTAYTATPDDVAAIKFAKLFSSNSTGVAVVQTAARTVKVILKS